MTQRIAIIPGDGIGVEVVAQARRVLDAVSPKLGQKLESTTFDWGAEAAAKLIALRDTTAALPGVTVAVDEDGREAARFGAATSGAWPASPMSAAPRRVTSSPTPAPPCATRAAPPGRRAMSASGGTAAAAPPACAAR